jgi:hypothetical protein
MRRVIVIAAAGVSLAGCSSFSWDAFKPSLDAFKSTPPTVQVQLDSTPQGADARTSLGPGCKTPCSVSVAPPDAAFSVTYTKDKFQPATETVQVVHVPGDFSTPATTNIDPNPVVAELQAESPPKPARKARPRKPKPAAAAAPAPATADSAFPAATTQVAAPAAAPSGQ